MKLIVNGKEVEFAEGLSLMDFLQARGLDPRIIVVEYNYEILSREKFAGVRLQDGDHLEIVQMTAGG